MKHRSRSGELILYNGTPVTWLSKLQTARSMSTAEAAFSSFSSCVPEVTRLRNVLSEVSCGEKTQKAVMQDILGCISWKEQVQGLRRVKHIGLRYHYVRSVVSAGHIEVVYTPSEKNRADPLAKILAEETHEILRRFFVQIKVS